MAVAFKRQSISYTGSKFLRLTILREEFVLLILFVFAGLKASVSMPKLIRYIVLREPTSLSRHFNISPESPVITLALFRLYRKSRVLRVPSLQKKTSLPQAVKIVLFGENARAGIRL
jgi:hypothetical protein